MRTEEELKSSPSEGERREHPGVSELPTCPTDASPKRPLTHTCFPFAFNLMRGVHMSSLSILNALWPLESCDHSLAVRGQLRLIEGRVKKFLTHCYLLAIFGVQRGS